MKKIFTIASVFVMFFVCTFGTVSADTVSMFNVFDNSQAYYAGGGSYEYMLGNFSKRYFEEGERAAVAGTAKLDKVPKKGQAHTFDVYAVGDNRRLDPIGDFAGVMWANEVNGSGTTGFHFANITSRNHDYYGNTKIRHACVMEMAFDFDNYFDSFFVSVAATKAVGKKENQIVIEAVDAFGKTYSLTQDARGTAESKSLYFGFVAEGEGNYFTDFLVYLIDADGDLNNKNRGLKHMVVGLGGHVIPDPSDVPEPATIALLGLGLAGLALARRRVKK